MTADIHTQILQKVSNDNNKTLGRVVFSAAKKTKLKTKDEQLKN